jgi:signal transduction histidine kinase
VSGPTDPPAGSPLRAPRFGIRREIAILLPTALLLLAVVGIFTLFAYRSAIERLLEARRTEAARLARAVAADWRPGEGAAGLRRRAPLAVGLAAVDRRGATRVVVGDLPPLPVLAPIGGRLPRWPAARGPNAQLPGRIAAFAPLPGGGAVRVDLDAATLAALQRSQRVLSATVVAASTATLLLVVAFVGHLLRPYEELLARARQLGADQPIEADEVQFLLATFDQAMSALSRAPPRPVAAAASAGGAGAGGAGADDDMAALGRALAPSLESGLLLLDREGRVLALNPVGSELLRLRLAAPSQPLPTALAPHPELAAFLAQAVETGRGVQRHELELRFADEARTLGLTIHPLRHGDRTVRGFLVLFADLTAVQREAEELRLAESLAQLGELSAGVAHELRNSLGTLRGYLTLLARTELAPPAVEYVDEMRRETAQVQRVVDDFLAFARPGTARLEPVRLDEIVQRVAADPALGAAVVVDVAPAFAAAPPLVLGDEQLLARAVRNLVDNAVLAHREAGVEAPVECALDAGEDGLELRVEDRGRGIPEEVQARLFHPFATGRQAGVGLGLALTHRIVDLHGGRIRIEDRPGGGTRATIVFPPDTLVTEGNEERESASGASSRPAP